MRSDPSGRPRGWMSRLALAILMVAVLLPVSPNAARASTLADALVAAYRNSNLLDQNRALLRATDEDLVQAHARLLPVINFVSRFLTNSAGAPDYRLSFAVSIDFPLIDFGRGALGVDLAREQILSARAGLIVVEQRVLLQAIAAYLGLYNARQTVTLQRSNVSLIEEQLRAARERFELGASTRTDVAIAEARLAAARSALAAAEGDVAVAREDFRFAVGRYPNGALRAPPRLPSLPASLEAAQARARSHHPAILQAQHQVSAADLATRITRTERFGSVSGNLSLEARRQATGPLGGATSSDVTASLGYQVPLYAGGRLNSAERQSIARAEAQRAALHQTVAQVNQAVGQAWAQLSVARARLEASTLQIEAAQAALDAVTAEAELGSLTTLDVLNSEQELQDARASRMLAGVALQQAAYVLLESTGQLTVSSLNLGIPVYDVAAYYDSLRRPRQGSRPAAQPSAQGQRLDRIQGRFTGTNAER